MLIKKYKSFLTHSRSARSWLSALREQLGWRYLRGQFLAEPSALVPSLMLFAGSMNDLQESKKAVVAGLYLLCVALR